MADSFTLVDIKIDGQTADPKTDRLILSGFVTLRAEYGDTVITFDVRFDRMASSDDAMTHALRHAGNVGHFIENRAGDLERRIGR
jgi:hypothetical protein